VRRQLPTYSPITGRALLAGVAGALGADSAAAVRDRILGHWGARDVILTGSGTEALTLALQGVIRRNPGPVALPAYGCYDLATAALGGDVDVVLYDLDPETLQPEPESLASALAAGAGALVLVHLYGVPVDVAGIAAHAHTRGVVVIEDAAQGMGAEAGGRPVGSSGSLAIFSFGRGKGLTGGAGGALLANDAAGEEITSRARASAEKTGRAGWSELARTTAQWLFARPSVYDVPASLPFLRLGETVFHAPDEPRAMSRASMRVLDRVWTASHRATAVRRSHARKLLDEAESRPGWRSIRIAAGAVPGYLRLPLLPPRDRRDLVLTRAAARLGVIQGYPRTLAGLPDFRERCINRDADTPGAHLLAQSLLTLPTHELLSASDLHRLRAWLSASATISSSEIRSAALV
jgi:perosamine synthetase